MTSRPELMHRDDLSPEEIAELEQLLGRRVVCAGDIAGSMTFEQLQQLDLALDELRESWRQRVCASCGEELPAYVDPDKPDSAWYRIDVEKADFDMLICPACSLSPDHQTELALDGQPEPPQSTEG